MSEQSAIPYIGSKISLISNAEIRYEGILHTLNTQASNISLQSVRCFGTEGRKEPEIPPTNEVYDFIIFRGRDIKDLTVLSGSYAAQSLQMNDPAIMSVNQRPAGGKGAKGQAPKGATGPSGGNGFQSNGWKQGESRGGDRPDRKGENGYAKGSSGKGGEGAKAGSKGGEKGAKGSGKSAKGASAKGSDSGKGGKAAGGKGDSPKGEKAGKGKGGSSASGTSAKGGAKSSKDSAAKGSGSKDGSSKDADAKGKGKGGNSGETRAKGSGRSRARGRAGGDGSADILESDDVAGDAKDFDFAAASARFEKARTEDANGVPKSGYDKSKSFFDNISGEAGATRTSDADRSKADRDSETFGDGDEASRPAGGRHRKGARRGGAPRGKQT